MSSYVSGVANIFAFLSERSCYQGREVTQADQGTEEPDKEDPWCEEGQFQHSIFSNLGQTALEYALFVNHVVFSLRHFADQGRRCQEEIRTYLSSSFHYQPLLGLGRYPCGNVAECLIMTRKDFAIYVISWYVKRHFVVSYAKILRNLVRLSYTPVVVVLGFDH